MLQQKKRDRREEPQGLRHHQPTPPPSYELPLRPAQPHETEQSGPGDSFGRPHIARGSQSFHNFPGALEMLAQDTWNPYLRANVGNQVLSPPVSPGSQPIAITLRQRDPRERSPARDRPVKAERHSQQNFNTSSKSHPVVEDREMTSSSMSMTPRPEGPNRQNSIIDGPNYVLYRRAGSDEAYTPNTFDDVVARQHELFQGLERICTTAARTYWHSQCRSTLDIPRVMRTQRRGRRFDRRASPYELQRLHRSQRQTSLLDYLMRICSHLWTRATLSNEHSEELEAVHRMGNLYSWGERVMVAARGGGGGWVVAEDEEVYKVVMAARDMCSWCLCEEGKREIDGLWEGEWVFRGCGIGRTCVGG